VGLVFPFFHMFAPHSISGRTLPLVKSATGRTTKNNGSSLLFHWSFFPSPLFLFFPLFLSFCLHPRFCTLFWSGARFSRRLISPVPGTSFFFSFTSIFPFSLFLVEMAPHRVSFSFITLISAQAPRAPEDCRPHLLLDRALGAFRTRCILFFFLLYTFRNLYKDSLSFRI